jgi:hypothetical protein
VRSTDNPSWLHAGLIAGPMRDLSPPSHLGLGPTGHAGPVSRLLTIAAAVVVAVLTWAAVVIGVSSLAADPIPAVGPVVVATSTTTVVPADPAAPPAGTPPAPPPPAAQPDGDGDDDDDGGDDGGDDGDDDDDGDDG